MEEKRDGWHAGGRGGRSNDMVGGSGGGAWPLHCGGVGLQLDGAVSLTCLRNPPAPCAGDLRAHPRRQRVPLLKSPSSPKQTPLSPNDRGSHAFEMLTL